MTAVEARQHIRELEAERAAAIVHDAIGVDAYRRDLEAEIETWRELLRHYRGDGDRDPAGRARRSQCRLTQ